MSEDRPPLPTLHAGQRRPEGPRRRGWLEQLRSRAVTLAYSVDSVWRNRSEFFNGRAAIVAFLTRK